MKSEMVSKGSQQTLCLQRFGEALERLGIENADAEFERLFTDTKLADMLAWQHLRTLFKVVEEFWTRLDQRARIELDTLAGFDTRAFFYSPLPEVNQEILDQLTNQGYDGGIVESNCLLLRPARKMTASEAKEILSHNPCLGTSGFAHLMECAKREDLLRDEDGFGVEGYCGDVTLMSLEASHKHLFPMIRIVGKEKPAIGWLQQSHFLPKNTAIVVWGVESWTEWKDSEVSTEGVML
jgi:hypothetical protein